jgi:hypothetical protein
MALVLASGSDVGDYFGGDTALKFQEGIGWIIGRLVVRMGGR